MINAWQRLMIMATIGSGPQLLGATKKSKCLGRLKHNKKKTKMAKTSRKANR